MRCRPNQPTETSASDQVRRAAPRGRPERFRGLGTERRRRLFEQAVALVELRFGEPRLTIDEVARYLFASRRQLQRAFAEAGTSMRVTVRRVRMEHAAQLLCDYRLRIAQVGRRVGYAQPGEFAKAFRRYYGCSPSEWRRVHAVDDTPQRNESVTRLG